MNKKKSILFMVPHLGGGGAEKVLVTLINSLDIDKYDIGLVVSGLNHARCKEIKRPVYYYSIGQPNNLFFGKKSSLWQHGFPMCFESSFVKEAFNLYEYDVNFLVMDCLFVKILPQRDNDKISIFRITSDYLARPLSTWVLTEIDAYLKMHTDCYKSVDYFVAGSQQAADSFVAVTGVTENVSIINNMFDVPHIKSSSEEEIDIQKTRFTIGSVGNFRPVKGHMRLLEACHRLNCDGFSFDLWLIGAGSEEMALKAKTEEYGMDNVKFLGYQDNPYKFMRHFDLYVNPAFTEGFPNAPCEAVILGIPCVVADHCGEREIFGNSEYGLITANSEEGLYDGIKKMLSDKEIYDFYKDATVKRQSFFDIEHVLEQYEQLFEKSK